MHFVFCIYENSKTNYQVKLLFLLEGYDYSPTKGASALRNVSVEHCRAVTNELDIASSRILISPNEGKQTCNFIIELWQYKNLYICLRCVWQVLLCTSISHINTCVSWLHPQNLVLKTSVQHITYRMILLHFKNIFYSKFHWVLDNYWIHSVIDKKSFCLWSTHRFEIMYL